MCVIDVYVKSICHNTINRVNYNFRLNSIVLKIVTVHSSILNYLVVHLAYVDDLIILKYFTIIHIPL